MTKRQFQTKLNALLREAKTKAQEKARRLVTSGAVDINGAPDDYRVPRAVLWAALRDVADELLPDIPESRELAENLRHF